MRSLRREFGMKREKNIILASIYALVFSLAIAFAHSACSRPPADIREGVGETGALSDLFRDTPTMLTVEEGLAIVREKFPDMSEGIEFTGCTLNWDKSIEWLHYENNESSFWVNSKTKLVDNFFLNNLDQIININDNAIDLQEARIIAVSIIQKYRPDFNIKQMTQTIGRLEDHGGFQCYLFDWREYRDNVDIGNDINIEIALNGELISYAAGKNDVQVDTKAEKMNEEDAVGYAKQYLSACIEEDRFDALMVENTGLIVWNQNRVCWKVELSSQPQSDGPVPTYYYCVILDAQTGAVVNFLSG